MAGFRFIGEGGGSWLGRSFSTGDVIHLDDETEAQFVAIALENRFWESTTDAPEPELNFDAPVAPAEPEAPADDADGKLTVEQYHKLLNELGVDVDGRWGLARLAQELDKATSEAI
jgi:hypothetical protein